MAISARSPQLREKLIDKYCDNLNEFTYNQYIFNISFMKSIRDVIIEEEVET